MADKSRIHPKRLGDTCTLSLPSWRRSVFPIACAIVAASGGALLVRPEPRVEEGIAMVAVGLVSGALFLAAVHLFGRLQVRLDRDGMTVARLVTVRRYRWDEVSRFAMSARSPGRSAKLAYVAFDAERGLAFERAMNRLLTGHSQMLPIGLVLEDGSGDAAILTDLLNAWRDRALKHRRRG